VGEPILGLRVLVEDVPHADTLSWNDAGGEQHLAQALAQTPVHPPSFPGTRPPPGLQPGAPPRLAQLAIKRAPGKRKPPLTVGSTAVSHLGQSG
jgi:hypothetical protein